MNTTNILFRECETEGDYYEATRLFKEYADSLSFDLGFQNFEEELKNIQQQYGPPSGTIILAQLANNPPVGCAGIRKFEDQICELKRMYVSPKGRGKGIGKELLAKALTSAQALGYQKMRLDTLPDMTKAISLYESVGFYPIEPYRYNPFADTKYYEILLNP